MSSSPTLRSTRPQSMFVHPLNSVRRRRLLALAPVSDRPLGIRLQQLTAQRQAELDRAAAAARAAELARFQREISNRD